MRGRSDAGEAYLIFGKASGFGTHIEAIGDYNGDGRDDILWRHDDGTITNWLATEAGGFTANEANLMTNVGLQWQVQPNFSGIGDWDY